jgi:hypothetical protein
MIDPVLARALTALNDEMRKLQGQVKNLQQAQTQSQLGHSSIDDGFLTVVSGGTVRQIIGVQPDGTVTSVDQNAPAPPSPSTPTVTPAPAGLTVAWDGTFPGAAQPLDFANVEVHVSTTPGFTPSIATLRGALLKAGQTTVTPLSSGTTYYVGLVAANTSGVESAVSAEVSGVPSAVLFSPVTASEIGYIGVLNANPYFTGGDITGWIAGGGTPGTVSVVNTQPAGSPYAYALQMVSNVTGGGDAYEPGPPAFPAIPSTQYMVTGLFYTPGTSVNLGLSFLLNGVWVSDVHNTVTVTPNTWTQVTTVVTAPSSGINGAGPMFSTPGQSSQYTMYGQAITALPQVPGGLIQAGTITATQLAAASVTAGAIAAGTIVAGIVNGTTVEAATLLVDSTGPGTGEFIYNGTGALGNLIGSWSAVAGTDAHGNPYPIGLSANQGMLTGVGLSNAEIASSQLDACTINNAVINAPSSSGGTALELAVTFDTTGGNLLIYTSTTTTTTITTAGEGTWTAPAGSSGSAKIECWGAGGGAGNFAGSAGGGGGGGGEYACEPNYQITAGQTYTYNVGAGGDGTTNGGGGNGNDTWFDAMNVFANGGTGGGTDPNHIGGYWARGIGGTGSTNTVHHNGAQGGNGYQSANAGGGGGGSSAGPAAAGNNGLDGNSSGVGGTGGSAPTGGGAGGHGGNSNVSGSAASAPGGGGGGAGNNGGSSSRIDTFDPTGTYSYYGSDNTQGFALNLSNANGNMQQGCPNNPAIGTFFSFAHYNYTAIQAALSGRTIDSVSLTVDCLHSWWNSGMTAYLDYTNIDTFPSNITFPSSTHIGSFAIGQTQTEAFSLPTSVGTAFQSGAAHTLMFSAPSQNPSYYGYFQGGSAGPPAPRLVIVSHSGSSTVTSAAGGNGQMKITYISGSALAASFSSTAFTDAGGNSIPIGIMTNPMYAIQPGSSPAVEETWHAVTPASGWTLSGMLPGLSYRLLPDGNAQLEGNIKYSGTPLSGWTMTTLPSAYWPNNQRYYLTPTGTKIFLITINTNGTVTISDWAGNAVSSLTNPSIYISYVYPLNL